MAAISVTIGTKPVVAVPGVSKTRRSNFTLSATGVLFADLSTLSIAFGKSAAAPATFADLANPNVAGLTSSDGWNSLVTRSATPIGAEPFTLQVAGEFATPANAAWSPGDTVWYALFNVLSPSSGDVPIATAGPFLVIA